MVDTRYVAHRLIINRASVRNPGKDYFLAALFLSECRIKGFICRVIIKAGSKGRESGPKVGSKFGQSNNNTKLAPIGMKFGT